MAGSDDYGFVPGKDRPAIAPPAVDYAPPRPRSYSPRIGLVGAGGISEFHLKAYRRAGYGVAAIADRTLAKAEARRDEFFPEADACDDYRALLARDDIEVVDLTPHPDDRLPMIREALEAGKHVLSQKPFVLSLDDGEALADLAEAKGLKLAVNQNGRWAPHFSYMRNAVAAGLLGPITSIDVTMQWDQTWIAGNPGFEKIRHLVLFDFAIHWFDFAAGLMADREAERLYASERKFAEQVFGPAALAAVVIDYPGAQVRMGFNAHTTRGEEDVTTVVGTTGTLRSRGPGLNDQPQMEISLEDGEARVPLDGCWFEEGFEGAMGELLCAIEEDREPLHGARGNLKSLALCFAALASVDAGRPVCPGDRRLVSGV
ncbi:MAG: Gfo/Idh/MocA family oxidoreductase [Akkermansiaceae bacterium]|nr:Gfo/Idh/MocA family oxidoreductase [Akkermansiaceae bacterium]